MMKISIFKFRCWQNVKLSFNPGEITLVKGVSGGGKSTILQAITWCLFGNVKCITPFNEPKAKTQVTIEFDNLKIIRSRNPSILQVYCKDSEDGHLDAEAQTIINSIFSRYDLWLCSSYVAQSCRNSFLTSPNQDKTQLLRELAFKEEDPKIVIEAIDRYLINFETKYKLESSSFNKDFTNFENKLFLESQEIQNTISENGYETLDYFENLSNILETDLGILESKIEKLKIKDEEVKFSKNMLSLLKKDLEALLKKEPIKKSSRSVEEIENINEKLERLVPLLRKKEDTIKEIGKINILETDEHFTLDDLLEAESLEKEYNSNLLVCKKIGLKYEESVVKEYIESSEKTLSLQEPIEKLGKLVEKNRKLVIPNKPVFTKIVEKNFVPPDENVKNELEMELASNLESLKELEKELELYSQGLNVLICPCCKEGLKIVGKKLILSECAPSTENEMNECKTKISLINKKINETKKKIICFNNDVKTYHSNVLAEEKRINKLREEEKNNQLILTKIEEITLEKESIGLEIEKLKNENFEGIALLKPLEKEKIRSNIFSLRSVSFSSLPQVSSKKIKDYFNNLENCSRLNNLKIELQDCEKELQVFEQVFEHSSKYRDLLASNKKEIKEIENYISCFESWSNAVKEIENKISQIVISENKDLEEALIEKKSLLLELEKNKRIIEILIEKEKFDQQYDSLSNDHLKLGKLRVLKQKAIESEYQTLETTSETINSIIGEICSYLFDEHIEIEINMFKNIKSNKDLQKAQINFSINYQGGNYDSINQLSGGEGDRASLALTLALNKILCSPILMFDESLASLDNNMKEISIKSIKHNISDDTIVIVVMHDGIEGIYDEIIDISEIRNSD